MLIKIKKEEETYNSFTLTVRHATAGKILALQHALENYQTESTIGAEALDELNRGIENCTELQEFLRD